MDARNVVILTGRLGADADVKTIKLKTKDEERRVIEIIDSGAAKTSFMRFGDTVRMEARPAAASKTEHGPFGVIEQRVVAAVYGNPNGAQV